LFITGRIKELIITAGGENVPPVLIENIIKEQLPAVSNCVVIGDKRKFLTCLLTLRADTDPDNGQSTDQLLDAAIRAGAEAGSDAKTVSAAKRCPKFMQMIQDGIDRYNNEYSVSRAQNIRRWYILDRDLSLAGGELTPTMKVRRKQVDAIHAQAIEALYIEDAPAPTAKL
jgi:long-chain-fatty-acid--CoA ligase ACSBG